MKIAQQKKVEREGKKLLKKQQRERERLARVEERKKGEEAKRVARS